MNREPSGRRVRRSHSSTFKAKAAMGKDKTIVELYQEFELQPLCSTTRGGNCSSVRSMCSAPAPHRTDGPDAIARQVRKRAHQGGVGKRKAVIDREHLLSVARHIYELHLGHPLMIARILQRILLREGMRA